MIAPLPDPAPYPIERLSREELAAALRKGQGRAYLHVQRYGLDGVEDLVLAACLHNQVFDVDLENLRGDWLFSMFRGTPHLPNFRDQILQALSTGTEEQDLRQLCELGACLAGLGDDAARQALHEVVVRFASDPTQERSLGARDWLELAGAGGMLELARIYGQRLLAGAEDNVDTALPFYDDDADFLGVLRNSAGTDPAVRAYLEHAEAMQKWFASTKPADRDKARRRTHRKIRQQYRLAEILAEAKSGSGSRYRRGVIFGRHATQKELERVYAALIRETDEAVQMRLLWVFRRAKLPQLDDRLFRWAREAHDDLRSAAIAALSQVSDERVHALAREKARAGALLGADHEALGLFRRNYAPADAQWIAESLAPLRPDAEDADALEFSIIELADAYADPALGPAVLWAYENTPCVFGRSKAIRWLHEHQLLPEEVRFECQYDAEVDNREYIGSIKKLGKEI